MKISKKIIAVFLIVVTLFSVVSVTAFADNGKEYVSSDSFFNWLAQQAGWAQTVLGYTSGLVCPKSEDSYHHADFRKLNLMNTGYYTAVCEYCGETFVAHESDLKQSYDDYVQHNIQDVYNTTYIGSSGFQIPFPLYRVCRPSSGSCASSSSIYGEHFNVTIESKISSFLLCIDGNTSLTAPVDGYYSVCGDLSFYNCVLDSSYLPQSHVAFSKGTDIFVRSLGFMDSGNRGSYYVFRFNVIDTSDFSNVIGRLYLSCEPFQYSVDSFTEQIGGSSSRVGSYYGDYGIIGDNGTINKTENNYIFDETTNNYYNPHTGLTSTVTDWTYDYSDRSYNLTLDTGDSVTVTYGDENITIQEGDQTYNVYYVTTYNVSEGDIGADGHLHQWGTPTDTTPATCTTPGSESYTCSECGESKTVQIPALGHKWKVLRTVQTKYDDSGQLVQQGYTLYECERCGEQYKQDATTTGPPEGDQGGGSDDGPGGDTSFWDDAVAFFKSIAASFSSIPDWFSRFSEFLSSAFSYLPPDIVLLLTFGVFAVVVIGIWKAVRR